MSQDNPFKRQTLKRLTIQKRHWGFPSQKSEKEFIVKHRFMTKFLPLTRCIGVKWCNWNRPEFIHIYLNQHNKVAEQ